jgi:hypothetical protein
VLNLDAELELIDPGHRRSARMRERIAALARALLPRIRAATGEEPVLLDEDGVGADGGGEGCQRGEAWCPTPRALARLRAAGVEPPAAPPLAVLRRVNHRAFTAGLGPGLPGAGFATTVGEVRALVEAGPEQAWLLKRPLGFSGRMRKVVRAAGLDAAALRWIAASMEGYGIGLQVEPLVERLLDVALHGRLGVDGALRRGAPVVATCAADGAFVAARRAGPGELSAAEGAALAAAFDAAAVALSGAGYSGPFCIDGFRWRDQDGAVRFQPLSELNARYTMAWWTGMHG